MKTFLFCILPVGEISIFGKDEELISYGKYFELFDEDGLRNQIKRLNDPVYSKNAFTYNLGVNIIKKNMGNSLLLKIFKIF